MYLKQRLVLKMSDDDDDEKDENFVDEWVLHEKMKLTFTFFL